MEIANLNQRIQIQKAISKTDEVGNVIRHWQDFYSCFASIKTTGGKERQKGDTEEWHKVFFTVRFCKRLAELSSELCFVGIFIILCRWILRITAEK